MAGLETATLTIKTVPPGEFFPTTPPGFLNTSTWEPLTTPFTPPASVCAYSWFINISGDTRTVVDYAPSKTCWPGAQDTHSPGTVLSDYHIVNVVEYRTPGWTSGGLRVWGAACCRSGWTNIETAESLYSCISIFTSPITAWDGWAGDNRDPKTTSTILSSGTARSNYMSIYWMESDLSKFDPEYAATLKEKFGIGFTPSATMAITSETASPPARTQLTSATSSAVPGSQGTSGANSSGSGLDTGAKAGVGVGVAIAAILMGVAGFLMYKKRVQKQRAVQQKFAKQNEQPEFIPRQRT